MSFLKTLKIVTRNGFPHHLVQYRRRIHLHQLEVQHIIVHQISSPMLPLRYVQMNARTMTTFWKLNGTIHPLYTFQARPYPIVPLTRMQRLVWSIFASICMLSIHQLGRRKFIGLTCPALIASQTAIRCFTYSGSHRTYLRGSIGDEIWWTIMCWTPIDEGGFFYDIELDDGKTISSDDFKSLEKLHKEDYQ